MSNLTTDDEDLARVKKYVNFNILFRNHVKPEIMVLKLRKSPTKLQKIISISMGKTFEIQDTINAAIVIRLF